MPDINCIVALLAPRHEHHERVVGEMERRLAHGESLVIAAPTLVETYAVLTRLPAPHRLSPVDCRALIDANIAQEAVELVALAANDYRRLIHDAPAHYLAGGRAYDAVIAACAHTGRVDILLTFNERHVAQFAGDDLAIVVPS